jgi:hypothetical protein
VKARVEHRRKHLQQGLLDQTIQRPRHPHQPLTAPGFGDRHPPDRPRPVSARIEPRPGGGPLLLEPSPNPPGRHPVDARGTGVLLDTSQRPHEAVTGEKHLPQTRLRGVRRGLVRRRGIAPLSPGIIGRHPPTLPSRPQQGSAAITAIPTSTGVLRPGTAFGPSRRPSRSPPIPRPLLTSPRRAAASRPPPSQPQHPWRPPRIRTATSPAHPPRPRNGPLTTTGSVVRCRLAQTVTPPPRFVSLRSRVRLPPPPPPHLTVTQSPSAHG